MLDYLCLDSMALRMLFLYTNTVYISCTKSRKFKIMMKVNVYFELQQVYPNTDLTNGIDIVLSQNKKRFNKVQLGNSNFIFIIHLSR